MGIGSFCDHQWEPHPDGGLHCVKPNCTYRQWPVVSPKKYTVPEAGLKGWELAEKHYKKEIAKLRLVVETVVQYKIDFDSISVQAEYESRSKVFEALENWMEGESPH